MLYIIAGISQSCQVKRWVREIPSDRVDKESLMVHPKVFTFSIEPWWWVTEEPNIIYIILIITVLYLCVYKRTLRGGTLSLNTYIPPFPNIDWLIDLFVITTYNQQYIQVKDHRIPHSTRCCLPAEPRHTHTNTQAYKHTVLIWFPDRLLTS